jgi:hypothetical protein
MIWLRHCPPTHYYPPFFNQFVLFCPILHFLIRSIPRLYSLYNMSTMNLQIYHHCTPSNSPLTPPSSLSIPIHDSIINRPRYRNGMFHCYLLIISCILCRNPYHSHINRKKNTSIFFSFLPQNKNNINLLVRSCFTTQDWLTQCSISPNGITFTHCLSSTPW